MVRGKTTAEEATFKSARQSPLAWSFCGQRRTTPMRRPTTSPASNDGWARSLLACGGVNNPRSHAPSLAGTQRDRVQALSRRPHAQLGRRDSANARATPQAETQGACPAAVARRPQEGALHHTTALERVRLSARSNRTRPQIA